MASKVELKFFCSDKVLDLFPRLFPPLFHVSELSSNEKRLRLSSLLHKTIEFIYATLRVRANHLFSVFCQTCRHILSNRVIDYLVA